MSSDPTAAQAPLAAPDALPPISAADERRFNRLASTMEQFHAYFRSDFDDIYDMADGKFAQRGMSLPAFLAHAVSFKRHLEGHHNIEETYIFPRLAKRMPEFAPNDKHRTSHKGIHDGLDALSALVTRWRAEPSAYSPAELRACLDGFRDVLFRHLDEEVADLAGTNMRRFWSLEEMQQFMV